jgi:hypothetical protein
MGNPATGFTLADIEEIYAPQGTPDYAPYLAKLKDCDAVGAWFHGADAAVFLMQYHQMVNVFFR